MPALLDKLQKREQRTKQQLLCQRVQQQKSKNREQQQHTRQRKRKQQKRLHYRNQLYQHQAKNYHYQYRYYQHNFQQREQKRTSQHRKFYNLNTKKEASKSSHIIIITETTTTTSTTLPPLLPLPTATIPIPSLIPTRSPKQLPTTSTYSQTTNRRLCAVIFALILSIICHYSNAQQISIATAMMPEPVTNFEHLLPGQPHLSNNTQGKKIMEIHHKEGRNFSSQINITTGTQLSAILEQRLGIAVNDTTLFENLSIFDLKRNEDEHLHLQSFHLQPIFDFGMPRNITGRTGQPEVVIKCRVDMLNDKSVSWIRKRDLHILTVGPATYTTDKRFEVSTSKDEREWSLHVKAPQTRDSGIYECQVNTEPKISMAFQLNVIEIPADAKAIIIGPPDLHFKVGSSIVLQCLVAQPTVKDIGPIYWYRGEQLITPFQQNDNSDYDMGAADSAFLGTTSTAQDFRVGNSGAVVATIDNANSYAEDKHIIHDLTNDITPDFTARIAMESQLGDTLKSRLRISNAQTSDTGNYTCQPTTASSASVMVHVINDENPAAMQKSRAVATTAQTSTLLVGVFFCYCLKLLLACHHTNIPKSENRILDRVMVSSVSLPLMIIIGMVVMAMTMMLVMLTPMVVPALMLFPCLLLIAIAVPFIIVVNVAVVDGAAILIIVLAGVVDGLILLLVPTMLPLPLSS